MDSNPLISIIVPIYKAEKYLHRCIDSILAQTLTDFELLLIDDGSPDNSGKICDEYAQKDARIRVFHKENGGVSSARQCGIDNAIGQYTIHADPDDWVEPRMLEELYAKAKEEDADMVICDFYVCRNQKDIYNSQLPKSTESKSLLRQYLGHELHGSVCNKLIKRNLYSRYGVYFPIDIILWEDLFVVCSLLMHPIKVAYLPHAYYHYDITINDNSIVKTPSKEALNSQINFITYFSNHLPSDEDEKILFRSKAVAKNLAFCSQFIKGNDLRDMYKEINDWYVSTYKYKTITTLLISLFIQGYTSYNVSITLYKYKTHLFSTVRKVLNKFNK